MIDREIAGRVRRLSRSFPALTVTGPRQSGKTTLCRALFPDHPYANLEHPETRSLARDDPRAFLDAFPDGAVIDEIQRCPELPSWLQGRIDDRPEPGRWILTGSQNLLLLASVSQSLAGRAAVLHLPPLSRPETCRFPEHPATLEEALVTGGYPAVFDRSPAPADWYASYVATYVERDVRTITNVGDLVAFQRFLVLCAGRTAQLLNLSSLASDVGVTQPTARSWLSILETSFLTFRLPPFAANVRKRIVRMPKLHFLDSGLVCWLLGIRSPDQLRTHPLRGPIFESYVVSEVLKHRWNRGENAPLHYFRDRQGNEADLVLDLGGRVRAVEVKAGKTVTGELLRAAARARDLLAGTGEVETFLVHGGDARQRRSDLTVLPWDRIDTESWIAGRSPPS